MVETDVNSQTYRSWASHSAGMWKPSSRGFERWVLLLSAGRRAAFEFVTEFIVCIRRVRADASRTLRTNAVVFKSDLAYTNASREESKDRAVWRVER